MVTRLEPKLMSTPDGSSQSTNFLLDVGRLWRLYKTNNPAELKSLFHVAVTTVRDQTIEQEEQNRNTHDSQFDQGFRSTVH